MFILAAISSRFICYRIVNDFYGDATGCARRLRRERWEMHWKGWVNNFSFKTCVTNPTSVCVGGWMAVPCRVRAVQRRRSMWDLECVCMRTDSNWAGNSHTESPSSGPRSDTSLNLQTKDTNTKVLKSFISFSIYIFPSILRKHFYKYIAICLHITYVCFLLLKL